MSTALPPRDAWMGHVMTSEMQVNVGKSKLVVVKSFVEASQAVRAEIEAEGLGASGWYGNGAGDVSVDGVVVARISYNGRVWNLDGSEKK